MGVSTISNNLKLHIIKYSIKITNRFYLFIFFVKWMTTKCKAYKERLYISQSEGLHSVQYVKHDSNAYSLNCGFAYPKSVPTTTVHTPLKKPLIYTYTYSHCNVHIFKVSKCLMSSLFCQIPIIVLSSQFQN